MVEVDRLVGMAWTMWLLQKPNNNMFFLYLGQRTSLWEEVVLGETVLAVNENSRVSVVTEGPMVLRGSQDLEEGFETAMEIWSAFFPERIRVFRKVLPRS